MVASASFAEFLREQLVALGRVTMRRMFGKTGVFCNGLMFGMVADNTLYFRVDDHNRAEFKEAASFPPLSYEKKGSTIDLSFWRAPERLFDGPDELVTRARLSLGAARRVAVKRERTAPRRKSKSQPTHNRAPAGRAERENSGQKSSKRTRSKRSLTATSQRYGISSMCCAAVATR
jgi:DNA transformation protein and related proteins